MMEEVVFGLSKNRIGQMWLHHTGIDTSRLRHQNARVGHGHGHHR